MYFTKEDIKNKKITIIGLKKSGYSAAILAYNFGAEVFVSDCEDNKDTRINYDRLVKKGIKCEIGKHSDHIFNSNFWVISPGVPKNIDIIHKYDKDIVITCLHFVGIKKSYYIKRFKIETNQQNKLFSFIDESRSSKFIKSNIFVNSDLEFNYRLKNGEKKSKTIIISDFIDIKGWKALGNKLPNLLRMSGFKFNEIKSDESDFESDNEEINKDSIDKNKDKQIENNDSDELTLF